MKKIYLLLAVLILSLFSVSFANTTTEKPPINIYFNGVQLEWSDAKPFIDGNGRSMIPLRAVSESLGAEEVTWDGKTSTAKVKLGDKTVELPVGKNYGMVNGVKQEFDTVTIVSNGRTFVPLRFVSEALGYEIKYRFGKDERANNKNAHIIDIGSKTDMVFKPRVEVGWLNATLKAEEEKVFLSLFKKIPAMPEVGTQVMTAGNSVYMASSPTAQGILFDAVIGVTYVPKNNDGKPEHVAVGIQSLPTGWDEFLLVTLEFMVGNDGVVIANDIIKNFKSVYDKEANIYRISKLPKGLTVTSGKYTFNYETFEITWPQ